MYHFSHCAKGVAVHESRQESQNGDNTLSHIIEAIKRLHNIQFVFLTDNFLQLLFNQDENILTVTTYYIYIMMVSMLKEPRKKLCQSLFDNNVIPLRFKVFLRIKKIVNLDFFDVYASHFSDQEFCDPVILQFGRITFTHIKSI